MNEFTKTLKLNVISDASEIRKTADITNAFFNDFKLNVKDAFDSSGVKAYKRLKKEFEKAQDELYELALEGLYDTAEYEELTKKRNELETLTLGAQENYVNNLKDSAENIAKEIASQVKNKVGDALESIADSIVETVKNGFEEATNLGLFSGKSTMYSAEVTGFKQYGLEGREAYAWSKALEDTGFSSMDDYFENMAFADKETLNFLQQQLTTYRETYDVAKDEAAKTLEIKTKFDTFKNQMEQGVIRWLGENGDLLLDATTELLNVVKSIANFFTRTGNAANRSGQIAGQAEIAKYINSQSRSFNSTSNFNITGANAENIANQVNDMLGNIFNSAKNALA